MDSKARQQEYYRASVDAEFEIRRPHGCGRWYDYLMAYKIERTIRAVPINLRDQPVLNVCCGSGMDAEFIARQGARVIGLDLSRDAVRRARERARRFGFPLDVVVADAEHLPFADEAVALAFVHDGLHHLDDPHRAIRELVRVAWGAVALVEPANAAITRAAVRVGVSEDFEDAGNYIYRLSKGELVSLFRSLRLRLFRVTRYLMYYHHEPKRYYRVFDWAIPFRLLQFAFLVTNAIVGRWGNKIMCVAVKDGGVRE